MCLAVVPVSHALACAQQMTPRAHVFPWCASASVSAPRDATTATALLLFAPYFVLCKDFNSWFMCFSNVRLLVYIDIPATQHLSLMAKIQSKRFTYSNSDKPRAQHEKTRKFHYNTITLPFPLEIVALPYSHLLELQLCQMPRRSAMKATNKIKYSWFNNFYVNFNTHFCNFNAASAQHRRICWSFMVIRTLLNRKPAPKQR